MNRGFARWLCVTLMLGVTACGRAPESPPSEVTPAVVASPTASEPAPLPRDEPTATEPAWQKPEVGIARALWRDSLAQADAAMAEGRWVQDERGPGALDLYLGILLERPDHAQARAGLATAQARMRERFEIELDEGHLRRAARLQEWLTVIENDAAQATARAERLVKVRQAAAAVARAQQHLQAGRALEPPGQNAVADYQAALGVWPSYQPALTGLATLRNERLRQAWTAAQQEDYEASERALRQARRIGGDPAALQDMAARIVEVRQSRTQALLSQAHAALDALDLPLAEQRLAEARRVSLQSQGLDALADRLQQVRHYGRFAPRQRLRDRLQVGSEGPELVVIAHGRFLMGSPEDDPQRQDTELPQHEVGFARGFALARTETTVAEFRRFVEASGYRTLASRRGRSTVYDEKGGAMVEHPRVDWQRDHAGRLAAAELPVIHIAYEDAQAYADWLSKQTGAHYRLPSEAEFEYALRAGGKSRFAWGDAAPTTVVANLTGDGDRSRSGRRWSDAIKSYADGFWGVAPVRSFPEEGFGTFDLIGNVSEWVQDCWHDSYRRAPNDGSAWVNEGCEERVVRGGSWASTLDRARSAYRQAAAADQTHARLGFRVVREL